MYSSFVFKVNFILSKIEIFLSIFKLGHSKGRRKVGKVWLYEILIRSVRNVVASRDWRRASYCTASAGERDKRVDRRDNRMGRGRQAVI